MNIPVKNDTQKLEYTEIYCLCNKASKFSSKRNNFFFFFLAQNIKYFFSAGEDFLGIFSQAILLTALRQCVSKVTSIYLGKFCFQESPCWQLERVTRIYFIKFHLGQVSSTFRFLWNFQTEITNVIGKRWSSTENYRKPLQVNCYF